MKLVIFACLIAVAACSDSTVVGPKSLGKDDAISDAKCPAGELGVGCSCAPLNQCDGAHFLDDQTCRATHRWGFNKGHIRAHAKCLPLLVRKTSAAFGKGPKESCDAGYKMTDCQVFSPWSQDFKNHMKPIISGNSCAASTGCRKCKVQAVCVYQI